MSDREYWVFFFIGWLGSLLGVMRIWNEPTPFGVACLLGSVSCAAWFTYRLVS